jgi:ribonuclease-3
MGSVPGKVGSLPTLCHKLGISFADQSLLRQALTHTSYANERQVDQWCHNERLEFLGDAILDLIISEYLYRNFTNLPEGDLTKARAVIVCEQSLARLARLMGLGDYILLGKGEAASGGRERASLLADAVEAIIGAIYLDSGFVVVSQFVLNQFANELALIGRGDYVKDYKTLLQELVQRDGDQKIQYEVLAASGPDHSKTFEVAVLVNGAKLGAGIGKNKKEAEQNAARQALESRNNTSF